MLFREQTDYQLLEIQEDQDLGRCLFLDGRLQSSRRYEAIYHENLVHPAMVLHPMPRRVFIAGGGEGATLREVLRHMPVEHVTMVEIDEAVVRVSRDYLQEWHRGSFSDSRVELVFADARAYLHHTTEQWDCIIIDVTCPIEGGPAWPLFTREFYQLAQTRLTENGVFVQAVGMGETGKAIGSVLKTLGTVFRYITSYAPGVHDSSGPWSFAIASNTKHPAALTKRIVDAVLKERACFDLTTYSGTEHEQLFRSQVPSTAESQDDRVITDADPLFVP